MVCTYVYTVRATYNVHKYFLALIFYYEEIFCLNFQIRILRHLKFHGKNFITCTTSIDEISSFFQNFQLLKMAFFSSWETENLVLRNKADFEIIHLSN